MNKDDLLTLYKDLPNKEMWVNEALFGYEHIQSHLEKLRDASDILEIGSGSGILLSLIQSQYPTLNIDGIEPFSDGFDALQTYQKRMEDDGIHIAKCGYEDFETEKKYDFIFLINVFEHLPDWRDFILFTKRHLKKDGVCLILCPNYSFPYESHFKLPIIWNKRLTYKIFKKQIEKFEEDHDCAGLWKSLNFVKLRQVRKTIYVQKMNLKVDTSIINDIIERLNNDEEFYQRQKIIAKVARLVQKIGLLKLLNLKIVQNIAPYMKIEVRR